MRDIIGVFLVWNILGITTLFTIYAFKPPSSNGALTKAKGFEFFNPLHIHKYNQVNWFGAFMVAILYNLICPGMSICYWLYKFVYFICTVGKK